MVVFAVMPETIFRAPSESTPTATSSPAGSAQRGRAIDKDVGSRHKREHSVTSVVHAEEQDFTSNSLVYTIDGEEAGAKFIGIAERDSHTIEENCRLRRANGESACTKCEVTSIRKISDRSRSHSSASFLLSLLEGS
jgi:hypothetical protein